MPKGNRWILEKENDLRKAFGNMALFYMRPLPRKPGMIGIFTVQGDLPVGSVPAHPSLLRRTLELLMEQARARDVRCLPRPGLRMRKRPPATPQATPDAVPLTSSVEVCVPAASKVPNVPDVGT